MAEAERNDVAILEAARRVFVADPRASMAELSRQAGVGMGALYARFPSKDALLGHLCLAGLRTFIEAAERALGEDDPVAAWVRFLGEVVDAEIPALTVRLAGLFTPTTEHARLAAEADDLGRRVFGAVQEAGGVASGVDYLDVDYLLQAISMTHVGDRDRTLAVRRRQLVLLLGGLMPEPPCALPGTAPTPDEQELRWTPGRHTRTHGGP